MMESIGFVDDDGSGSELPERFVCRPELGLSLVVRGMGASTSGAPAAELTVRSIVEHLERGAIRDRAAGSGGEPALPAAIQIANRLLFERTHSAHPLASLEAFCWAGSVATLAALHVEGDSLSIAHVGNCRAYLVDRAALRALTIDHTLAAEFLHVPPPPGLDLTALRDVLIRVLGAESTIPIDVHSGPWSPGDRVLLCTPALATLLDEHEIGSVLDQHGADLVGAGRRLLDLGRTRRQARPGPLTRFLTFTLSRRLE